MVSVIIPNYNHEAYLKQRIESVLSQTYTDLELILLDDASSDNSRQIIEQYSAHPKVIATVFNNQNSGSTFKQWKKGLDLAHGEWIWIAESDDFCEPEFLERLLNNQVPDEAGLRYCRSKPADANGVINTTGSTGIRGGLYEGQVFFKDYLIEGNRIPNTSAVLIRSEVLRRCLLEDTMGFRLVGDWLTWLRCVQDTDVFLVESELNYHRTHNESVRERMIRDGKYFREFLTLRKLLTKDFKNRRKPNLIRLNRLFYLRDMLRRIIEIVRSQGSFIFRFRNLKLLA